MVQLRHVNPVGQDLQPPRRFVHEEQMKAQRSLNDCLEVYFSSALRQEGTNAVTIVGEE